MGQVIGFVHNHDLWYYGTSQTAADVNRYPSENDWSFPQSLVSDGAGGADGAGFALYVVDTSGHIREFQYSHKAGYQMLTQDQKDRGVALPDELEDDGSSCT